MQLRVAGTAGEMGRGHEHHLVRPHPPPPAVPAAQTHRQPFGQEPPDRLLATRLGLHAGLAHVPVHDRRHVQILAVVQRGSHRRARSPHGTTSTAPRCPGRARPAASPNRRHATASKGIPCHPRNDGNTDRQNARQGTLRNPVRPDCSLSGTPPGNAPGGDLDDMPTHDTNSTPSPR